MSTRQFITCKTPISNRGAPTDDLLNALVDFGLSAPDEIFAPNAKPDIYGSVRANLGPWQGPLHRRAVMLEVLRVLAAFESSDNWREGVDTTNKTSMANLTGQETGIFQVSADSMAFDPSLRACVVRYCGSDHPQAFIDVMKINHQFAIEYCARLLRFNVRWDGPISRGEMQPYLRRSAVAEFQAFLSAPVAAPVNPPVQTP